MAGDLSRLLSPTRVAVVGGREAETVIRHCEHLGFEGTIWPVNPYRVKIADRPCFPTVDALPEAPDAAFVGVSREKTIEVVASLAKIGAGAAVCYASGFAESGPDGAALQDSLVRAAGSMPLLGPNCYGLINAMDRVALWPDEHGCEPVEGGVAIITQSSNIGLNLTMPPRGLPISHVIAVGNQAGVCLEDCIDALVSDRRVQAIGLHIESIIDSVRFGEAATRALARKLPIVALKTGGSEVGASITRSHTAAVAEPDAAYDALFARYGVYRVHTLPALLESLSLLSTIGTLPGNHLASMSGSGGEAALIADRSQHYDVVFPAMERDHSEAVAATLSELVAISNPLDYHTFIWGDRNALTRTFTAVLQGPYDAAILMLDFPGRADADDGPWWAAVQALVAAHRTTGTPAVATATLPESMPPRPRQHLQSNGVACLHGIDETLQALEAASWIGSRQRDEPPVLHAPSRAGSVRSTVLDEAESKRRLAAVGLPVPAGRVASVAEAARVAQSVGFPVALKVLGVDHKADHRAVVLNLEDATAVRLAAAELSAAGDHLLVESMIDDAVAEILVGIRKQHSIGYLMTLGAGGSLVELAGDLTHLLLPVNREEVAVALSRLRVFSLISGYRRGIRGDVDAVIDAIMATGRLALDMPELVELEINPLLVRPAGRGVAAVDALIHTEDES